MAPTAATIEAYDRKAPGPDATETATFALGCFWGPDAQFGALDGVIRTRVGYAGGTTVDPTYHDLDDHTEAIQVDYAPETRSFAELLALVFQSHDPQQQTRKTQYQNIVFIDSPDQQRVLTDYLDTTEYTADGIATRIEQHPQFHPAEDYHQKYSLRSKRSIMSAFESAGYDEAAIRESPAAAKLNGHVGGHELSDSHELGIGSNRHIHDA